MEVALKEALGVSFVKKHSVIGNYGGVSTTSVFLTNERKIFVKTNSEKGSRIMFEGELAGLEAISKTGAIKVPTPYAIFHHEDNICLAMEHLQLKHLGSKQSELGRKLGELHLHNSRQTDPEKRIDKFGFLKTTCCGFLPMDNTWNNNWLDFYVQQRIEPQLTRLGDETALGLWRDARDRLPALFPDSLRVIPSLLHGDLWSGNCGEYNGEVCLFDPAVFYGHNEFDLAIARMFGGFDRKFFESYHALIPKHTEGFEGRALLYDLFHHLNHWNHFGSGYRGSSIGILHRLARL